MRLDGVEVKVSLDSDQTEPAVHALGLLDVPRWRIFFIEDVTTGLVSSTPLLDHQLIIRAREKAKGADDVTVKFRPGRRSQLGSRWLGMTKVKDGGLDAELKVEEDWAGARRSLAISLTAERRDGLVTDAAEQGDVPALLTGDQRRLIEQCAGVAVNLEVLSILPAISAMRWPAFPVPNPGGSDLSVRAERWTVGSLDFLELSIAVHVEAADASQKVLGDFVASMGLEAAVGESKTSQVMQLLVTEAARATT